MDNIQEYIKSGVLELYAMGALSAAEQHEVEQMLQYDEVRHELNQIMDTLEQVAVQGAVEPPAGLKAKIELELYHYNSGAGKKYAPLISKGATFDEIYAWVVSQEVHPPANPDETYVSPLDSNARVVNFLAWSKDGHPLETHDDYYEYIVVLDGGCTMDFNGVKSDYTKGDIISIPLHTQHYAKVTSTKPMWALVQREMI